MTTGYQIYNQHGCYFLTFQIVQWADIFTRQVYRDIVSDSFNFCIEKKGLRVHGYVMMSNHVHCILSAKEGNLSALVRDLKAFTAKKIWAHMDSANTESRRDWLRLVFKYAAGGHNQNKDFQIWTHENHAVELESQKFKLQKLNYIHQNPVRAGLVPEAQHYLYSSAADYYHGKQIGKVKLDWLEL